MKSRHLRSLRQSALRIVLTRARGTEGTPGYISQRPFAKHIKRTQPWVSQLETLQRRCEILEFIDLSDAHYEDRLELYRQLVDLVPRRLRPIRKVIAEPAPDTGKELPAHEEALALLRNIFRELRRGGLSDEQLLDYLGQNDAKASPVPRRVRRKKRAARK